MGYIAFMIDKDDRDRLLNKFNPKYKNITCDHITHQYPAGDDNLLPDSPVEIEILGYHDNGSIEYLIVKANGKIYQKESTNHYHITISFNENSKPKDSNAVIQDIIDKKGIKSLYNLKNTIKFSSRVKKL